MEKELSLVMLAHILVINYSTNYLGEFIKGKIVTGEQYIKGRF